MSALNRNEIEVAKQRDHDAAIFRAVYPSVHRLAAVVAPAEVHPDDLVQEALVRTLGIGPLSELEDATAYLCRAVVNLAKNERRRSYRQWQALARHGSDHIEDAVYPSDLTDLMHLDAKERAVLFLHHVEGHSFQAIADVIGASEPATRRLASRARRKLRVALTKRSDR